MISGESVGKDWYETADAMADIRCRNGVHTLVMPTVSGAPSSWYIVMDSSLSKPTSVENPDGVRPDESENPCKSKSLLAAQKLTHLLRGYPVAVELVRIGGRRYSPCSKSWMSISINPGSTQLVGFMYICPTGLNAPGALAWPRTWQSSFCVKSPNWTLSSRRIESTTHSARATGDPCSCTRQQILRMPWQVLQKCGTGPGGLSTNHVHQDGRVLKQVVEIEPHKNPV